VSGFGFQFSAFSFKNHASDFELRIWLTPETWNPFCTLHTAHCTLLTFLERSK
jgi:hypothetical protein